MDRFIEGFYVGDYLQGEALKSNMDRFIGFYVSKHNFKNAL